MKKIYHIAEDVSRASGGVRTVVSAYYKHILNSVIITTCKDASDDHIRSFKKTGPWLYSRKLKDFLTNLSTDSIFHIHGVWMFAQFIAAKIAIRRGIPFIISPHGMFEPYLWKEGRLKKKVYFELFTSSAFAKANAIHAITPSEHKNLKELFPKQNIVCIPNAIAVESLPKRQQPLKPYFLFLGRLHPIKGLDLLLKVFNSLDHLNCDLYIAGPSNSYSKSLEIQFKEDKRIKFLGAVWGSQKKELYLNAQVFVAPSFTEVIGMVNLEAAMMATPVITTYETGLLPEWSLNGGMLINQTFEELESALKKAYSWNEMERNSLGRKLRQFVIDEYSWKVTLPKWENLYTTLTK